MQDQLRLDDSTMTNKDLLLGRLRYALAMLNGKFTDAGYIKNQLKNKEQPDITSFLSAMPRIILSEIRYEINSFRDNVWEGLVHARNRLLNITLLLGFVTYVLLMVAIIGGAAANQTLWALVYFTIGAIVGVFSLARTAAAADAAVDDFGLSRARTIHTPLFSGLAAVIGVVLVAGGKLALTATGTDGSTVFLPNRSITLIWLT